MPAPTTYSERSQRNVKISLERREYLKSNKIFIYVFSENAFLLFFEILKFESLMTHFGTSRDSKITITLSMCCEISHLSIWLT